MTHPNTVRTAVGPPGVVVLTSLGSSSCGQSFPISRLISALTKAPQQDLKCWPQLRNIQLPNVKEEIGLLTRYLLFHVGGSVEVFGSYRTVKKKSSKHTKNPDI